MKKKKAVKKIFYADTETTQFDPVKGVRVYLWCAIDDNGNEYFNFDVDTLYKFLATHDAIFYFHNLKFDWSYVEYYALTHGIKYKILERKGTIFSVKFGACELRDSINLINCSLQDMGNNYCTQYKKTSIDYEAADYDHKATAAEIEYCLNDCYVLREGLTTWKNNLKEILLRNGAIKTVAKIDKKLTYAGIAFEAFKELSLFDECCPKTTLEEYNQLIGAYHGGYVYSNPGGIQRNIMMIDCNSIYPYIYSEKALPYGNGFLCDNEEEIYKHDFYIINVNISFDLKPGFIPIIGGGFGKYGGINYQRSTDGQTINITVCRYDWELIKEFYYVEYEYCSGYWWNTQQGFYKRYCDIFMAEKINAKSLIVRSLAKMMLNSPYGKTAMNGTSEIVDYFLQDDVVHSKIVGYEVQDEVFQYLPQAISITAQARQHLLHTAKSIGFDKVAYMDTDSIKFDMIGVDTSKLWIHPKQLGAWKDEGHPFYFKTIAPKKYIIYEGGKLSITCAGFNKKALTQQLYHGQQVSTQKARLLITKFDKGLKIECLQSKKVKGGRALLKVWKEII